MANQPISPQMPQKVEAIEKLGFGVMDKIFLAFDKVFWDQVLKGLQASLSRSCCVENHVERR